MGERYRVSFTVEVPSGVPYERFVEWLRFELHDNGVMEADNPLETESLEPVPFTLDIEAASPGSEPQERKP